MSKLAVLSLSVLVALGAAGARAEDAVTLASADEAAKVAAAIARIGCKAEAVEKESANLFEIDDAQCEIGQYDIKLNGDYKITVMTSD